MAIPKSQQYLVKIMFTIFPPLAVFHYFPEAEISERKISIVLRHHLEKFKFIIISIIITHSVVIRE